ncbi:MAG: hypothetical protein HRT44_01720 [Bdellovibrionales bacterium]|nr:hypothetical protein [Bdellovibrionales bacterium]NQZ17964.1 hypothetical protein [Bdellovibrionales bacterium]
MPGSAFTPKRIRRSVKLDRVNPADFRQLNIQYCCEQCSHFCTETQKCTIGFPAYLHTREIQLKRFNSHSHMAFCRFHEID